MNYLVSARGWRAAWAWAVVLTLALRVGLGLLMGATWVAISPNFPAGRLADPSLYGDLPTYTTFPADALLGIWQRWDAVHHLNLAQSGYFGVSEGDSVFYPLYAYVVRMVTQTIGADYVIGGLIVSTVATMAALACLYRLADQRYGSASARWTVTVLAVYPTSFFLIAPYTESLFLALTMGAFLAGYERRWWLAGVLAALGSLTRGPGLFTSAALGWIAWDQWRNSNLPNRSMRWAVPIAAGVALPILGGLGFLLWRTMAGFAPMTEVLSTYSGLEVIDPLRGLMYGVAQLVEVPDLVTGLSRS